MRRKKIDELLLLKNNLIVRQAKRIKLLEEKMIDVPEKYFQLKYADVITQ